MEFSLTEEQEILRDTANSFLEDFSNSQSIRKAMESDLRFDPVLWKRMASEMGWTGILVPENYGGIGLSWVELVTLMEQMGKNLLCSPFHPTVCLGISSLLEAGNEEQKSSFLPLIASGELIVTLACLERSGSWLPEGIETTFEKKGSEYCLNGIKRFVPYGHSSDLIIVAARKKDNSNSKDLTLFLVGSDNPNISINQLATMDQTRPQSELKLSNLKLSESKLLGKEGDGWEILNKVRSLGALGIAADQVGGAQKCLDMTCKYVLEREQFGRKIGSFQSIKHRLADMMVLVESARSSAYYAACLVKEGNDELDEAISIAKSYCSEAYFKCASDSIQLHGGVGFTWEYDVHLYFKRAKSSEIAFGSPQLHKDKIANFLGI